MKKVELIPALTDMYNLNCNESPQRDVYFEHRTDTLHVRKHTPP